MRRPLVFAGFWIALFLMYLPAAGSGWVSDTLGWLQAVRTQSFSDFVARKGFSVPSYYQLTQIVTWCFYQLFGANRWAWHLLQLSLHALNSVLVFTLLRGILLDSGIWRASTIAIITATLFCSSPYVSEVIVWEAAYHFLQGLMLLLIQLQLLRRFLSNGRKGIAILSVSLYAISLFSLELFYLSPLLCGALCLYYQLALGWERQRTRKAWLAIILPQAVLLVLYFIGLRLLAGATTGRLGNDWIKLPITYYLVKPPEYVFHLLGGRFMPQAWRNAVYDVCSSYVGAGIFYGAFALLVIYAVARFRRFSRPGQLIGFLAVWLFLAIGLVSSLWFPERLLINGDRYLYALILPFFGIVVLGLSRIRNNGALWLVFATLILLQIVLTVRLNCIWQDSSRLTDQLQKGLIDAPGKITILLNNPASLQGAPMIGAGSDGEAALMHDLFYTTPITAPMRDAPAVHLLSESDSVHVQYLDEETIKVSLTQPGTFWQYGPDVARSFSMEEFSVSIDDPNCCYTLRLNYHPSRYRLLYQYRGIWHELNIPNK